MPHRSLHNYLYDTRRPRAAVRFSRQSARGKEIVQKPGIFKPMRDFFVYDFLAWITATWRVRPPYDYPGQITGSVYDIDSGHTGHTADTDDTGHTADTRQTGHTAESGTTRIAIAADWATDTEQAEYVGKCMGALDPHWTVHLGDTYYSGTEAEMQWNYGKGRTTLPSYDFGIWPRGSRGSFALAGNHEMFSSGSAFYNMIRDPDRAFGPRDRDTGRFTGQAAPCFCLRTPHWLVLGLDTGYDSLRTGILRIPPDNKKLRLPAALTAWLKAGVIRPNETRGIIVLTHHQYVSAFNGEMEFAEPARQLKELLPQNDGILWIWGHEHRFALYGRNQLGKDYIAAYGRCIGNGGMPDEHRRSRYVLEKKAGERGLVAFDARTADCFPRRGILGPKCMGIGYNGYALLSITGPAAEIAYYAAYKKETGGDRGRNHAVFRERWTADTQTGRISFQGAGDLTTGNPDGDRLTWSGKADANRIGQT